MVISNLKIKDTIEAITAEIIESVTLLEKIYRECDDEVTSATISCIIRSTKLSLRKADNLVISLLSLKSLKEDSNQKLKSQVTSKPTEENTSKIETITTCNSFAERLRLALAYAGMTQVELAKK